MEKEICSLKELRGTMTETRRVNPTLDLWLDSAYDDFRDAGGGSVEDFVAWLEGPDGPDAPELSDYAVGERTYVGYAADPETLVAELYLDCTPDELERAISRAQDRPPYPSPSIGVDDLIREWTDSVNEALCNDDMIPDALEDAIRRSGLTIAGRTPSLAELSDAIQAELDRGRDEPEMGYPYRSQGPSESEGREGLAQPKPRVGGPRL